MQQFIDALLSPLTFLYEIVLNLSLRFSNSFVISLFILALFQYYLFSPFKVWARKFKEKEQLVQGVMLPQIQAIPADVKGHQRHELIGKIYKRYNYHPIFAFRNSAELLIQVPFFVAAYSFLSSFSGFNGQSIIFVSDLSQPDQIFNGINALPFVMTVVSLLAAFVTPGLKASEQRVAAAISFVFLALLYKAPAGLVVFWTCNSFLILLRSAIFRGPYWFGRNATSEYRLNKIIFKRSLTHFIKRITAENFKKRFENQMTRFRESVFFLIFFVVAISVFSVNMIVFNNSAELTNFDLKIVLAAIYVFSASVMLTLIPILKFPMSHVFLKFICIWAICTILFPLSFSHGMESIEVIKTNRINLSICVIFSLAFLFLQSIYRGFRDALYKLILVAALIFSFQLLRNISIFCFKDNPRELQNSSEIGKGNNIFVLSFDGIPGIVASKILKSENLGTTEGGTFKDFVFFDNVISTAPATIASLMGQIYGVHDYKRYGESVSEITRNMRESGHKSVYDAFADDGYRLTTYGAYSFLDLGGVAHQAVKLEKLGEEFVSDLYILALANSFSPRLVRGVASFLRSSSTKRLALFSGPTPHLKQHYGPHWDLPHLADSLEFDRWVTNLRVVDEGPSAYFLHFAHSHFPVDLDSNCKYRSDSEKWFLSHQNEVGLFDQSLCLFRQADLFLQKIRALGIYDSSMIVLQSDHGEPVNYFTDAPDNIEINDHPHWGYNRFRPMLFVKAPFQRHEKLMWVNDQVLLNDVGSTLCYVMDLSSCDNFNGVNVLDALERQKSQSFYFYVPTSPSSSFTMETHKGLKGERQVNLLETLKKAGVVNFHN